MTISKGICITDEFKDAVFYAAHSICPCEDCTQTLIFEYDKEFNLVSLEVDATFENYDLFGFNWRSKSKSELLYRIWRRIKIPFMFFFTGRMSLRHSFMFKTEHIEDYIKALQEGYEKVKQYKKEQEDKK